MSKTEQSIENAITHYLLFCQIEGKRPRTIDWYRQKLGYFVAFLRKRQLPQSVDAVSTQEIRLFIHYLQTEVKAGENNPHRPVEERGLSPQTVAGYVRTLRAFFSWAVRESLLDENPMKSVKTPTVPSQIVRFFTGEEVIRLLGVLKRRTTNVGKRNYTMVLLLLDTGIRVSELVGLQMDALCLKGSYFKVRGKGNKERLVPLGQSSRRVLVEYTRKYRPAPAMPNIDPVFPTVKGYSLKPDYVYKIMSQACCEASIKGKRLGPHTCRHTFARNFLLNGGDLLTLQRILGHSSLEVVKLYVHLDTSDLLSQQWKFSPIDTLTMNQTVRAIA